MTEVFRHRFSPEAWILAAISMLDLATTVWLLRHGFAIEANPLLGYYLNAGPEWFILYKAVLLCIIPVGLIEWLRQRHSTRERMLRLLLRIGIVAYSLLYITMVLHANG